MHIFNFKRYFSARRAKSVTDKVNLNRDLETLNKILTQIEEVANEGENFFETVVSTRTSWIERKLANLGYKIDTSDKGFEQKKYSINW